MSQATRRPERYIGPKPSVTFDAHVGMVAPLMAMFSGEINNTQGIRPMGAAPYNGIIKDVWMSVGASGKNDTSVPTITGDVLINGTTCLSTNPIIAHVSGEASQQKTTKVTGDTGVTQAVVLSTAKVVVPGDVITCKLTYSGAASPTTKISQAVIVVELEPYAPGSH